MDFWIIQSAPLRQSPATGKKLVDIPFGAVVQATETEPRAHRWDGEEAYWREVVYQRFTGWVYAGYLERLTHVYPANLVTIPNQTPSTADAAQYMIWRGQVQYNLCGELCVCYITGNSLESLLAQWEARAPGMFKSVFKNNQSRGTTVTELESMLAVYSRSSHRLERGLHDPILGRALVSPRRMQELLQHDAAIVSVRIHPQTGNLQVTGILHWVVLTEVYPDGVNRGFVEVYNPFPNQVQRYSWAEFIAAMGVPYGLWVSRQ
jgi:hypothetical protein